MDDWVHSLWLAQDDQRKYRRIIIQARRYNTSQKSQHPTKKGIILEPLCGKIFGPEDHDLLTQQNGSLDWPRLFMETDRI